MITDARVLRAGFVPRDVEHRDAEVTHLTEILAPLTDGDPADTTLLLGPSGVGKTCLAKFTAEQLRQEVLDVEYQYVNCWQNFSEYRTIVSILEGLGKTLDINRQSTPRDELFDRLRRYDGPPCVVILDEADQLEEKRLLYHLHELPQFSMLLIANREEDLFAGVGERLMSRLTGSERVRFDRYSPDELVSIMDGRVRAGLEDDIIGREQLETIANQKRFWKFWKPHADAYPKQPCISRYANESATEEHTGPGTPRVGRGCSPARRGRRPGRYSRSFSTTSY